VFIEDLDSYNGIRINGERINGRYEVKEGDLVEIGDYHLALQAAEIEDALPQPQHSSSEPGTQRAEWPSAGTVPDFRLPGAILAGLRKDGAPRLVPAHVRDTIVDPPVPPPLAQPSVMPAVGPTKTPPLQYASGAGGALADSASGRAEDGRPLPPFPGSMP